MADEHGVFDAQLIEERRQHVQGFLVHEGRFALARKAIGGPVAKARIDERACAKAQVEQAFAAMGTNLTARLVAAGIRFETVS